MRNSFGDQGNMERNFWEQGNSVKVNFGEHLNLFLRNKGTSVNFHMHLPPPGRPSLMILESWGSVGLNVVMKCMRVGLLTVLMRKTL